MFTVSASIAATPQHNAGTAIFKCGGLCSGGCGLLVFFPKSNEVWPHLYQSTFHHFFFLLHHLNSLWKAASKGRSGSRCFPLKPHLMTFCCLQIPTCEPWILETGLCWILFRGIKCIPLCLEFYLHKVWKPHVSSPTPLFYALRFVGLSHKTHLSLWFQKHVKPSYEASARLSTSTIQAQNVS